MISLEAALAAYPAHLRPLPATSVATTAAHGLVLAEPAFAETDLPRFDQSALDGYALCAADVAAASLEHPVTLPIELHIAAAAQAGTPTLPPQSAARILTGAMMPAGADAMIPQERATRIGDTLQFTAPWPAGRNIRRRAEELSKGTPLAQAGQRIGPGLLASLINAEVSTVRVHPRPRIHVFATGDEIRPAGSRLKPGEIHDSNGPLIAALLRSWGHDAPTIGHLPDDPAAVRAALEKAFAEADLVITAGGASVGDKDYLAATAEALGVRRVFWKVAQKPAKPMFFGIRETPDMTAPCGTRQTVMLALPGNPGAVLIGMVLHARLVISHLEGQAHPNLGWSTAVLAEPVERDSERARLIRMALSHDAGGVARLQPLPNQDSHMLSNLGRADVLVWVKAGEGIVNTGTVLRWIALPA